MLKIIFTLDYEIHGNGDGSPYELMVVPSERLMKLFDNYGAQLTIFADIAEILKFKEFKESFKYDGYQYDVITKQLIKAVKTGHDVQLHIHPSYMKAKYENNRWKQNWAEYNVADLPYMRINELINLGKNFLEDLLTQENSEYKCVAFRAAGWSMMPTGNISKALVENNIHIDTSVWKNGSRRGILNFDYSDAHSEILPWFIDTYNINYKDNRSNLLEIPIYCIDKSIFAFLTPLRLYRVFNAAFHKHKILDEIPVDANINYIKEPKSKMQKLKNMLLKKHAWKLDFNQATTRQMIHSLEQIEAKYPDYPNDIPVVFSGHSKLAIGFNNFTLKPLLRYISKNKERFSFATFRDIDIELYRN